MFQSVLAEQGLHPRHLGQGMGASLVVHAGVLAAVLLVSAQAAEPVQETLREVIFVPPARAPAPPRGSPAPAVAHSAPARRKPQRMPRHVTPLPAVPPMPEEPTPPSPPPDVDVPETSGGSEGGGVVGGHPLGVDVGGVLGAVLPPGLLSGGSGEEAIPFGEGMTPPVLRSSGPLEYTREAREAHVSGVIVARCVITVEGNLERCRIIRGLPHMNEAVRAHLATRHYSPVHYQGRPTSVSYVFNIRLSMP